MGKTISKKRLRDDTARIVADIYEVSPDYVRRVRNGTRNNEEILATLIDLRQEKTKLIKHIESLIPVTSNPAKYARKKN